MAIVTSQPRCRVQMLGSLCGECRGVSAAATVRWLLVTQQKAMRRAARSAAWRSRHRTHEASRPTLEPRSSGSVGPLATFRTTVPLSDAPNAALLAVLLIAKLLRAARHMAVLGVLAVLGARPLLAQSTARAT
eukprot:scaffold72202_cov33-Phaeocystis_antarctica.AAC.1